VVLSLGRLQTIEPLERSSSQITAGAGVTLERLQHHVREHEFDFPVDHAARGSATIGGMVATNAGGHLAVRYGSMRSQVVGLEAVLPDGRIVSRLSGLLKDNAGFDLPGLLVGSEGVLAVVTRARLRLVPFAPRRATALLALAGMKQALAVLECLRATAPSLEAVDYFEAAGLRRVCEHRRLTAPFAKEYPVYLIIECAGQSDDDLVADLADAATLVEDSAVAVNDADRAALWLYREAHNESIRSLGVPLKLDVSVPVGAIPAMHEALRALIDELAPEAELILYGHLGDGNIHVNILGLAGGYDEVEEAVLTLAAAQGGSISAEHGVGRAKARWLGLCRSESEITLMRELKRVFDPRDVLNKGRVLPHEVGSIAAP
jgi:FAD/FMN-containing dehydrogenase